MRLIDILIAVALLQSSLSASSMALMAEPDRQQCAASYAQGQQFIEAQQKQAPIQALKRLRGSLATLGEKDIAWAWLASPTARYPHTSMGSPIHAGSLHTLSREGKVHQHILPKQRVFEDLQPRLVDLDGDGRDEIIVIEADAERGAALVAYGLPRSGELLEERARSAYLGLPFRWLNPVGFADFDDNGKLDIASITTPHIGGTLTLYRYAPPRIEPFAKAMDVSNHQMGDPNLQMHAILTPPGQRPTVIVPDMSRRALHALRWEEVSGKAQWKELADVKPLPGRIHYLMPLNRSTACAQLSDGHWWRIELAV
ncbi:VCBS repeat-containing protein [Variovorax sp. PCZ-1]|uniref:FG-GAP repeat domain-containing protein n=1 Tax=Variovorax sp. PCZ-1 TaxID=2835533 RepID=UPI001BCB498F|nr:VCBS repeat-containing protein [Variovorax sp. PCZ-1]MBS7807969.1 VCBS repeat-containing protein [Variovorax sp. PCZ-1]